MKILEVGASKQLDKPESERWDKIFNHRIPEYKTGLFKFGTPDILALNASAYDVIIFSLTTYDKSRFDANNPLNQSLDKRKNFFSCLGNSVKMMSMLCCEAKPGTRFILIGSISANEAHSYKTRPYYAMLKSAQRSFFMNMAANNPDKQFLELSFDTIQEGVAIKTVLNFLNKTPFNEQYQIIQCDGITPKEP